MRKEKESQSTFFPHLRDSLDSRFHMLHVTENDIMIAQENNWNDNILWYHSITTKLSCLLVVVKKKHFYLPPWPWSSAMRLLEQTGNNVVFIAGHIICTNVLHKMRVCARKQIIYSSRSSLLISCTLSVSSCQCTALLTCIVLPWKSRGLQRPQQCQSPLLWEWRCSCCFLYL